MAQSRMVRGMTGLLAAALTAGLGIAPVALGAEPAAWVAKVNDIYRGRDRMLPDDQRSEKTLLPAVGAIEAPPAELATVLRAALLAPGDALWSEADAWAQREPQRAALEALKKVGASEKPMAFLLLYGADEVPAEWKSADMYVDLGNPPLLAGAQFGYLHGLDRLAMLTHVEATRLGEAGQALDALNLLTDLVLFGRQMADREYRVEMRWGMDTMARGLERIRDVAWVRRDALSDQDLKKIIDRLDSANLRLDRLVLPKADRFAAEQVIEQAYVERQGPNPDNFGATMARLSAKDRPLTVFGESARWQTMAAQQAGTFDTIDAVADVFGGWEYRWNLPAFDRALEAPSDYERLDKSKFAMVDTIMGKIDELFHKRQALRAELGATRAGLAALAFQRRNKTFPSELSLTRPNYVKELERDPWSKDGNPFMFFVPIRDQPRGERDLPKPHMIAVLGVGGAPEGMPEEVVTLESVKLLLGAVMIEYAEDPRGIDLPDNSPELDRIFEEFVGKTAMEVRATLKEWRQLEQAAERAEKSNNTADYARAVRDMGAKLAEIAQARGKLEQVHAEVTAAREARRAKGVAASTEGRTPMAGMPSFLVPLDDSYFVLYSAATDQVGEWARSVGEGGSDILYWPSLLTLTRAHLEAQSLEPTTLGDAWIDFQPMMGAPAPKPSAETPGSKPSSSSPSSNPNRRRID